MSDNVDAIWEQMRSDFDATMLAFKTQTASTDELRATVRAGDARTRAALAGVRAAMAGVQAAMATVQAAMDSMRTALEDMGTEVSVSMDKMSTAVDTIVDSVDQQGQALARIKTGLGKMVKLTKDRHDDHERRITNLERRKSA